MIISRSYMLHGVPVTTRATHPALDEAARTLFGVLATDARLDAATPTGISLSLDDCKAPSIPAGGRTWMTAESLRLCTVACDSYLLFDNHLFGMLSPASQRITAWIPPALAEAPDFIGQMILLPLLLEALRAFGFVSIHAAALAHDGRAALFPAASGGGKTTLTLALLRAGFRLLSDDCPLIRRTDSGITAFAFAEPLHVSPRTAAFFPELRDSHYAHGRSTWEKDAMAAMAAAEKVALNAASVYGECIIQQCSPAALIFPTIGADDHTRLEPLAAPEALLRLLALAMPSASRVYLRQQLELLGDLVCAVPSYTLATGRDFERLPEIIQSVLDS